MAQQVTINDRVDVTDQECPMSFVKAKLSLEELDVGQRLEVRLRDGEQLFNVTRSFESEGQRIVKREPESADAAFWRLVVERGA